MSSPTIPPTDPGRDDDRDHDRGPLAEQGDLAARAHVGHETTDVDARTILWFGLVVAGGTIAVAALLLVLLRYYGAQAERRDPELSPLAVDAPREPAGPRLLDTPIAAFEQYRAEQQQVLDSYGWVDREQGIVRIPVSRAMEIALERGLPSPSGSVAPEEEPQQPPGGEAPARTAEPE
jgi:hypothetical protein